jgi:porin
MAIKSLPRFYEKEKQMNGFLAKYFWFLFTALAFVGSVGTVSAYDVTDRFSVGGVLAGAYQHQELNDVAPPDDSLGRGAVVFQPEVSFLLTDSDELFAAFGFADGNALNDQVPFAVSPWAANLEADVKNINGRDRDYLLEGWYKHTFDLGQEHRLALTGGIIDATGFLDENAYANDEQTQFMNSALVNGPHVFLPSYDMGGAVEWENGPFTAKGVYMNVGQNDPATGDNNFNFYGAQVGYRIDTPMGEGNYRVLFDGTSEDFLDPTGSRRESRLAGLISIDQQLGEHFGAWIRCGWQDDKAAVTYTAIYSGGVQINGTLFGRQDDAIGVGAAYLPGAEQPGQPIDTTHLAEAYWRIALHEYFALTLDAQYIADDYRPGFGEGPSGYILGARAVVEF